VWSGSFIHACHLMGNWVAQAAGKGRLLRY
jgi:hypothetical protein